MNTQLFLFQKQLNKLLLILMIYVGLNGTAYGTIYYVSKAGNDDTGTGLTEAKAFLTISKAALVAVNSGDVVKVGTGTYREQVNIVKSGITFQTYNGKVTINGTDLVGQTGGNNWTAVAGSTYKTTTGMDWDLTRAYGENQLFLDTTMIHCLRWPHNTSSDFIMPTMAKADGGTQNKDAKTTTILDSDFKGGSVWVGAQIFINLAHNGLDGQGWVGIVTAVSSGSITCNFFHNVGETVWAVGEGTEYYLFNPLAANVSDDNIDGLLGPGEWYKKGSGTNYTLYVKTLDLGKPNTTPARNVNAKKRYFAFSSDGIASNYTVDGFDLFGCSVTTFSNADNDWGHLSSCSGITIKNLTIRYISHQIATGDYQLEHAARTGLVLNGNDNTVDNCTITYSATSAISLQGNRLKATNNKIYNTNYMCSNAGAINTGRSSKKSLDLEIGYNLISNTTHVGIYLANFRNSDPNKPGVARVHHNTIVNYMRRSGDSGAIDEATQDLQWARIDHNYIYNTMGHDETREGAGFFGIYHDFGDYNTQLIRSIIDHNVVTNCMTPIVINDGTDVKIYNNVLIGNGKAGYENSKWSIGNYVNEHNNKGKNFEIYNNIMSHPISTDVMWIGNSMVNAVSSNNVENATIEYLTTNSIFVSPKFTGADRRVTDFKLRDNNTTRTRIIDKGLFRVGDYREDVKDDKTDLGAFEFSATVTAQLTENSLVNNVLTVFPNPVTSGVLTLGLNPADVNTNIAVRLFDLSGRLLYEDNFISVGTSQQLNIGNVEPGVYVISIRASNTQVSSNLTVQ
ncbi:MAG TPA: T9SS type A sorting domain-containing protein [Cytophagaceae bacterium]|jgi:hypothetical protein